MHCSTIALTLAAIAISFSSAIPVDSSYSEITTRDPRSEIAARGKVMSLAKEKGRERKAKAEAKEAKKYERLQNPGRNSKGDVIDITECLKGCSDKKGFEHQACITSCYYDQPGNSKDKYTGYRDATLAKKIY